MTNRKGGSMKAGRVSATRGATGGSGGKGGGKSFPPRGDLKLLQEVWAVYRATPRPAMIDAVVVFEGKELTLPQACSRMLSCGDPLPTALRLEIEAELTERRPGVSTFDGRREPDPRYWRGKVWTVAKAARELGPVFLRAMVPPR